MSTTSVTFTGNGVIASSDFKYIKWVGKTKNNTACQIVLPRAICRSNPDWSFTEKSEAVAAVEFEGVYEDSKLAAGTITEPWSVTLLDNTATGNDSIVLGVGKFYLAQTGEDYSASATYSVGDVVIHDGKPYSCNSAISTAEEWTAGHWTEIVPTCIGLTRGGGKFVVERTIRDINADDDPGSVMGRVAMSEARPKLSFNALQWLASIKDIYPAITSTTTVVG